MFKRRAKVASQPDHDLSPDGLTDAPAATPRETISAARPGVYVPALLFVVCLAAQLYLVFYKSFNWDEFLHFRQIYELNAGNMSFPFQTIHLRTLWWAPEVSPDLLAQMTAARLFVWSLHLVTLAGIYGVARHFTSKSNAFFAAFAYLTAGYVFTQSFSIRGDPFVTATLIVALFLMVRAQLGWATAIGIGALIGLAGMVSFKAAFFAPCFAGLAWLKYCETPAKVQLFGKLAVLAIAALLTFAAVYLLHTSHLAQAAEPTGKASQLSIFARWLTTDLAFAHYIGAAALLAPLFIFFLLIAPLAWKKAGIKPDAQLALAGFILPLAALLFYRNTFPYFFVFILAPVAVAIAPALGLMRDRYGSIFLSVLLAIPALALAVLEPRDVIGRQQALIDYVHREWPEKTSYLDYSDMIADYPRVLKYLTSGNGIRIYHENGSAIVGREISRGNVPFIIANQRVIQAALEGRPIPGTFLPADLAAMEGNYVRQWGVLWREGHSVPAGSDTHAFRLRRGGTFVLDGDPLTINGKRVTHGTKVTLNEGRHTVGGGRSASSTLWRGGRLPATPPNIPIDDVFTAY